MLSFGIGVFTLSGLVSYAFSASYSEILETKILNISTPYTLVLPNPSEPI
jgi:hypothetical protein